MKKLLLTLTLAAGMLVPAQANLNARRLAVNIPAFATIRASHFINN